ncbi:MAG: nucleotide sugar dehydrogenase [Candidatus Nanoarchaeia archaeon]|nr:nucleotide sugar dehydrogenase [Candidatus Nanoarchaeia archaeon]
MKVSIAGTGYVGLTSGVCFAELGHDVCCYDIDKRKIDMLSHGSIPIYEPGLKELLEKNKKRLKFTTDAKEAVNFGDIIFIGVGTPSREDGSVNLDYIDSVAESIGKYIDSYKVIVNKSTVPVGTKERVTNIIKKHYKGSFDVISSPEFLREGCAVTDTLEPDRIVLGTNSEKAKEMMFNLYKKIPQSKIFVTDSKSSELIKYASNTFLAFCISYVNNLTKEYPDYDVNELTYHFREKLNPRGFFGVGVGFGGSCFPKDVKELISFTDTIKIDSKILKEIMEINETQKLFFFNKIKNLREGSTIGVLGLAFKPDTDDMRDAPSISIVKKLLDIGFNVKAHDPISEEEAKKILDIEYCSNPYEVAEDADALILVTEWNHFRNLNLSKIKELMKNPLIYDGRNVFDRKKTNGFEYHDIGRGHKKFNEHEKEEQIKRFLNKCDLFAKKITEICKKVGANPDNVLEGMKLDSRIGRNMF